MTYRAPLNDILLSLDHGAGLKQAIASGFYRDFDADMTSAVLEEAAKFAQDILAPLNRDGDKTGVKFDNGNVTTVPGWKQAYKSWTEGGWNAVSASEKWGGQGLPLVVNAACTEIWSSANIAFGLCPLLTASAIEAL
ncbi:MAG: acyl-CoA dehydrogenase, partial [Hyphomicrobiales bacterium]